MDGTEDSLGIPVLHWRDGKLEDSGTLFSTRAAIAYRTARREYAFNAPRSNSQGATISIDNGIYSLTIRSAGKSEKFALMCGVDPDVFMYVAMSVNDYGAGIAAFKKLTSNNELTPGETQRSPARLVDNTVPPPVSEIKKTEAKIAAGPKRLSWEEGTPHSDLIVIDGAWIHILLNGDVVVAVALTDNGSYYVAELSVLNNGKTRVLVDPSRSRFLVSSKDGKEQTFEPIAAEKIAGKIKRRAMWANVLRAFAAGMATRQVTSTSQTSGNVSVFGPGGSAQGIYGETTTTTTTVPDREAQRNAAERNARATDEANRRAEGIVRYALKANTLFPGNALEGVIYFERKKSSKADFQVLIENTLYDFSFAFPLKNK